MTTTAITINWSDLTAPLDLRTADALGYGLMEQPTVADALALIDACRRLFVAEALYVGSADFGDTMPAHVIAGDDAYTTVQSEVRAVLGDTRSDFISEWWVGSKSSAVDCLGLAWAHGDTVAEWLAECLKG